MSCFTVLGAAGYVGRALTEQLRTAGHQVNPVSRATLPALFAARRNAGHVIDCIGLTGDFRARPLETAEAHVGITGRCLAELNFASFLYLSSTRVYARASRTDENAPLLCRPGDPSDLYNLTKLAGEALCLNDPRPTVRVVRLSNIYGPGLAADTFLGQVLAEGRATGRVRFHQAPDSAKDYVSLNEVLRVLPVIATAGSARLYNVAAGHNVTHACIAAILRDSLSWQAAFDPAAPVIQFPPIETARLTAEFGAVLSNFSADLRTIAASTMEVPCSASMNPATG